MLQSRLKEITGQHKCLIDAASKELGPWRSFLFAIDGRDGSGKSTLARFLAWQMDMPAIETDLYLVSNQAGAPKYEYKDLSRCIDFRLSLDRPVIVEGIFLLEVLKRIGFEPNYLVYTENQSYEGSNNLQKKFTRYEKKYTPRTRAGFVFSWSED